MAIPLLGAYASVSAGMALAGAVGATMGSMVVGGMMVAGGMMTAVGAISGDKNLSKYGGLLSLAGGVSGIMSGAWESAAQNIAQESTTAGYVNQMDAASDLASTASGASGAAASVAPGAAPMDLPGADQVAVADWSMDAYPTGQAPSVPSAQPPTAVAPQQAAAQAPQATAPAPTAAAPAPQQAYTPRPSAGSPADAAPKPTGGPVSDFFKWTEANPRQTQAGSGLLQAGLNYYGQQDAVKTSIRLNEEAQARARERMNASVKGLQMPVYQKKGG